MKYTVYVLKNQKGQLYKGMTNCLELRLAQHHNGLAHWTKNRGPFELVDKEEYDIKQEAQSRERFLKSGQGREYLKHFLKNGE